MHRGESSKSSARKRRVEEVQSEEEDGEENVGEGNEEESFEELTQRYVESASQAAKKPVAKSITNEETDKLVAEVMRYVLFKSHQQAGVPIRRDELVQVLTRQYKDRRGLPAYIIQVAQAKFPQIFGLELKELDRKNMKAAAGARGQNQGQESSSSVKYYVLRSLLPVEKRQAFVDTPEVAVHSGLTAIVLSLINLSGDKISEESLFNYVRRLGVREEEDHPVFGNLDNALQSMVKQRLILKEKSHEPGADTFVYMLADNSRDLNAGDKLQTFVSQLVEGRLTA
eukprot:TRINITY_DN22975_c0_g1_i1.p1 TRINITY_DN22975_c0_g1~~TRINITY_DN22975_c0_g1_i1.p1  ORF type:complete len:284 (-),score=70.96 TRINITY_DN22975_c0_g1_i1:424-1275(-)